MKICSRCKTRPALGDEAVAYNFKHLCKECYRKQCAEQRKTERGRAYIREYGKKRYQKFRHKALAVAKVSHAVKNGTLIKPTNCSSCLSEAVIYGHHEDYSKPLDVVWLCDPCHKHRHGRLKDLTLIKGAKS